jgi:hypothetical protein
MWNSLAEVEFQKSVDHLKKKKNYMSIFIKKINFMNFEFFYPLP